MGRIRSSSLLVAVLSLWISPPSQASSILEEWYVGLGAMHWGYEERDLPRETTWGGRLMGGVMFTRHVGLEAHFGMGGKYTVDRIDVELDSVDSLLLRLNAPITSWFQPYVLTGFSQTQIVINPEDVDATTENASGLSIGAGFEVRVRGGFALSVDGIRYQDEPGFTFQAATATLKWRF